MANQTIRLFISLITHSDKLNEKEKDVLIRRIQRKKLKSIGRRYKVTAERVRQIEKSALGKFLKKIYQPFLFHKQE